MLHVPSTASRGNSIPLLDCVQPHEEICRFAAAVVSITISKEREGENKMFDAKRNVPQAPLYRAEFEHDNCGIGAVVNIKGTKTRETVENALKIVENLEHRAGKDAEGKTGDGVGILVQICHDFFVKVTKPLEIVLGGEREYGVGMFFFPQDELKRNQAKKMFEIIVEKEGLDIRQWSVCLVLCRHLLRNRQMWRRGLLLIEGSTLQDVSLSKVPTIHMWCHSAAERLCIKECFL